MAAGQGERVMDGEEARSTGRWRRLLTRWSRGPVLTRRDVVWAAALFAAFVVVTIDVFVQGPMVSLDRRLQGWNGEKRIPSLDNAAWTYDKVGQRSVLIPVALIVAFALGRRYRTWRPAFLVVGSIVALNLGVGALKVLIGRNETETGDPSVLSGGVIYPSGHSSNMVLTGGLIVYLLLRYNTRRPLVAAVVAVISGLTLLTCATSIYIGSHWLTDLISGLFVGGLLLQAVIVLDRLTVDIKRDPPRGLRSGLGRWFLQPDRDRVDAVTVTGGGLGSVVEDVPQVRPATGAADLGPPHEE
jgi:membrane-associated phospholipid phosphatase